MKKGTLYVLPNFLGTPDPLLMPGILPGILKKLDTYVVEEIRSARRLIARIDKTIDIGSLNFLELNEHTTPAESKALIQPLLDGKDVGILSEAGLAAVADPGAALVRLAQARNIKVVPVTGPSSIYLALMASGLNGQQFSFEGYLPKERKQRIDKIREMDKMVQRTGRTFIFIEAPYRNQHLVEDLLSQGSANTLLCIGLNIQSEGESIRTLSLAQWKKAPPSLAKDPAIFLLGI